MSRSRGLLLWAGTMLLAVVVFILPGAAEAQNAREIGFGVKGGWTYTDTRGEVSDNGDVIEFEADHGFAFGGVLAAQLHPNVSIQPEGLFVRKQVEAAIDTIGSTVRLDYFEVPVLAKLHGRRPDSGAAPFALVGPAFSFLLSAEQRLEAGGAVVTEDIKDDVTSVDIGLVFGGGVDLIQDWGAVTIDGRYTFGLRNLDDTGNDDTKSGTFAVMGGVIF